MKKLILIFVFIMLLCNSKSQFNTLPTMSMKETGRIQLEENENVILPRIDNISVSPDGKYLLVSSMSSGNIVLYDCKTGKMLKVFQADISLSDTIALRSECFHKKIAYYVTLDNLGKERVASIENLLNNNYNIGFFKNDSVIIIQSTVKIPILYKDTSSNPGIGIEKSVAVIEMNIINGSYQLVILNDDGNLFPNGRICVYNPMRKEFLVDCMNYYAWQNKRYDSLWTYAIFDDKGMYVRPVARMPVEYIRAGLGYNFLNNYPRINLSSDYVSYFPILNSIYNFTNDKKIDLEKLPGNNDEIINKMIEDEKSFNPASGEQPPYMKYIPQLSTIIRGIDILANGNYLIYMSYKPSGKDEETTTGPQKIIREYSSTGKLLKEISLGVENELGSLEYISYSSQLNKLMLLRKSDSLGWTLIFNGLD